jgi:hypothetical protein
MVAAPTHDLHSGERFQGAQQHSPGDARRIRRDVEAVVHAVREVDIGVPGRAEHDGVAGGTATEGVRRRIGFAGVGLGLDDPAGKQAFGGAKEEDTPQ